MDTRRLSCIHRRLAGFLTEPNELFLVQSVEAQKLFVCIADRVIAHYDSSTSRFGNGCRENSYKTPLGIHRIKERIGAGAPSGRIFRHRRDTGVDWDGASLEENLILTRILRLEGLEEGANKGPGIDSFERFVYIHGTNREELVGSPLSHGCLCLKNEEMARLFGSVTAGTLLYIDPLPLIVNQVPCRRIHFTGIFGTGMSALAQYLRFQGIGVSDRPPARKHRHRTATPRPGRTGLHDRPPGTARASSRIRTRSASPPLSKKATPILPRPGLQGFLFSTAPISSPPSHRIIEDNRGCRHERQIHRNGHNLRVSSRMRRVASLISGAPLIRLERGGLVGNAYAGGSDLLVVEADESDGTLIKYAPEAR